ncbi:MAG TPA: fused MFS/spermidine synthase, partial [Rhizomicrobium sp.]
PEGEREKKYKVTHHPIAIEQNNATGRVAYLQTGLSQSVADARGVSLAEYIHAMYFYLRRAKAREVLMIGCGGGTLATMLHRAGARVSVVDIDPAAIEIARRYFHLPDAVRCHIGDGRAFLRRDPRRYDAIVLDAYAGGALPRQFAAKGFFDSVKAHLKPRKGLFLVNLLTADDADRRADRIAKLMGRTWPQVRLLDAPGWDDRNTVALAGAVKALPRPRLLLKPQRCARQIAAGLKTLDFREPRP